MTVTNASSGTSVHEIADGIDRISTPVVLPGDGGGFSVNQYLIVDDEPLLFHSGPRRMFPLVHEAIAMILPIARLRHVALSHADSDECGPLNEWLGAALPCGDLFTQPGVQHAPLTEGGILGPSESFRHQLD